MKLISWNVNARKGIVREQACALAARSPDLVALQEVRRETVDEWQSALAEEAGLTHFSSALEHVGDRHNFVAVASRWELEDPVGDEFVVPFAELVIARAVRAPAGPIELINTHVPNGSSYGWKKIEHFEGLHRRLARDADTPRVLCGDFNSPRRELEDGTVITWGQDESGRLRKSRGERWDDGERNVLLGLEPFGLRDVFRMLNGSEPRDGSWAPSGHEDRPRRFDHIFAPSSLDPTRCEYVHEWRTEKPRLSDHSAIEAVFDLD